MANLLSELVYVSLADARDTSDIFSATVPTDAILTQLITQAQYIIDGYIGHYGLPVSETQSFIFPTIDDNIPTDIKLATIRIAEYVYTQGIVLNSDKIVSESNMSRSISYSDKESYASYVKTIGIPKKVLTLISKYVSSFIGQTI